MNGSVFFFFLFQCEVVLLYRQVRCFLAVLEERTFSPPLYPFRLYNENVKSAQQRRLRLKERGSVIRYGCSEVRDEDLFFSFLFSLFLFSSFFFSLILLRGRFFFFTVHRVLCHAPFFFFIFLLAYHSVVFACVCVKLLCCQICAFFKLLAVFP